MYVGMLTHVSINSSIEMFYERSQHFGILFGHLVYIVVIWYIFPHFGILYQENMTTLAESKTNKQKISKKTNKQTKKYIGNQFWIRDFLPWSKFYETVRAEIYGQKTNKVSITSL
jgi:flagellar biosynthesis protein FliP